jgi:hypothetical protein
VCVYFWGGVPCVLWSKLYRVLVEHAVSKFYDGDVILTYAYSQARAAASCCGTTC